MSVIAGIESHHQGIITPVAFYECDIKHVCVCVYVPESDQTTTHHSPSILGHPQGPEAEGGSWNLKKCCERKPLYNFGGGGGLKRTSLTSAHPCQHQLRESPLSGKQPSPLKWQRPRKEAGAGLVGHKAAT